MPLASLLLLSLVCVSLGQEGPSEEWRDVVDPCSHYRCDDGSRCVPVVNELLQLPVAHCVEKIATDHRANCSSYEVGVSVVTCRTEVEWSEAAISRCGLSRDRTSVKVHHPCHRRQSSSPSIFLQATITCCHEEDTRPSSSETTPTASADNENPYYEQTGAKEGAQEGAREGEGEGEGEEETGGESVEAIVVGIGAGTLLLVVTIATIKIFYYCRTKRSMTPHKPKLSFVTAYINPSSEGWSDEWTGSIVGGEVKPDYSYIAANSSAD